MPKLAFGTRVWVALAFALGLGLAPVMPGTAGSLPGLALGYGIRAAADAWCPAPVPHAALIFALLAAATAFAHVTIARCEAALGIHDDQRIVIDEVVGQALTVAYLPATWQWYLAGFLLFRALDMVKPGPIGRIDREVPGAAGTLYDDVAAGAVAAVLLVIAAQVI